MFHLGNFPIDVSLDTCVCNNLYHHILKLAHICLKIVELISSQQNIKNTLVLQSNDSIWIPRGQHRGTVHAVEGKAPSEEASKIIKQLQANSYQVNKTTTHDDFIISKYVT